MTSRGCASQKASAGTGGRPAWWDSKQHQTSNPQSPPPMRPPPAGLVLCSTSPICTKSAEIVFSGYLVCPRVSPRAFCGRGAHLCDHPPVLMADQIALFRLLICSGPLQNLEACCTNQGIAPLLRAGGLDCTLPSTALREASTRALSLLEAHSTGGIRDCLRATPWGPTIHVQGQPAQKKPRRMPALFLK